MKKPAILNFNPGERDFRGHTALFVAYLIFGLNIPVSKMVLGTDGVTAFSLTLFRMIGAAALFWVASLFTRRERVPPRDVFLLFLASLLGIQLNQAMFLVGLSMTSPVDASVISTMVPILTMLLAALHLKEPITWRKALGVLIGASGALLLILNGQGLSVRAGSTMTGNLLCLLSALSFSCYLTFFKPLIARYSPVTLMKWMFLFAAICCTPFGLKDLRLIDYAILPWDMVLRILYVVVLATFLSYLLVPVGQKLLRPTVVGMYNYLQPLVASLVAVVLGLDVFGWVKTGAALLVFLGVYVVTTSKSRAQVDAERKAREAAELQAARAAAAKPEEIG